MKTADLEKLIHRAIMQTWNVGLRKPFNATNCSIIIAQRVMEYMRQEKP